MDAKTLFDKLDADKDGVITINDMIKMLENKGIVIENVKRFFGNHENMPAERFLNLMRQIEKDWLFKQEIKAFFDLCDTESRGCLTFWEIQNVFKDLEIEIDDEKLDSLLQSIDVDNDRQINKSEFLKLMLTFQ